MAEDVESLIERVSSDSGKSVDEIRQKMAERKEKTHGLLSDYGAVYAVAKEYGLDLSETEIKVTKLDSLTPSSPVTVAGRVKTVFSAREFQRKDGSTGRFASVIIVDETGESRIVLWDQNTEAVKKLRIGDILLVRNGYAKDNQGALEIHAGNLSNLAINPSNLQVSLPEIEETVDEIGSLTAGMPSINLVCRVNSYYPPTEFSRSDGSTGKRASFIGEDKSGTLRVVLWDNAAEAEIAEGDFVKLENAYTRSGLNDEVELQVGNRGRVMKTESSIKLKPLEKKSAGKIKISEVSPELRNFTLEARVLRVYEPREYSKGQMASLIVGDDSGTIRVVLWDDKASAASELKEGDSVRLNNVYAKPNLNNEPEVHVGRYGDVVPDPSVNVPTVGQISSSMSQEKSIADLENNDRFVKIKGKIIDVEDRPILYMTCSECDGRVQNLGGEWLCDSCGMVDSTPNMLASVILEDSTANIRAVAFKEKAEGILGMDLEEAMNHIGEAQDESAPVKVARQKIVGKKISLIGHVNYNDFSDQLEFIVDDLA
ncbi:MAG: OB-fold nucleic acid binding domain-containing protein [Candidatus Altiarchaeota archaeon]